MLEFIVISIGLIICCILCRIGFEDGKLRVSLYRDKTYSAYVPFFSVYHRGGKLRLTFHSQQDWLRKEYEASIQPPTEKINHLNERIRTLERILADNHHGVTLEQTSESLHDKDKQEMRVLKERIQTLERILTDNNHALTLEQEIESLRDKKTAPVAPVTPAAPAD